MRPCRCVASRPAAPQLLPALHYNKHIQTIKGFLKILIPYCDNLKVSNGLPHHLATVFHRNHSNWKKLLKADEYKSIIIEALQFLVREKKIELNTYVLMETHIHLIWQPLGDYSLTEIQRSFMTKTANDIKRKLKVENPGFWKNLK